MDVVIRAACAGAIVGDPDGEEYPAGWAIDLVHVVVRPRRLSQLQHIAAQVEAGGAHQFRIAAAPFVVAGFDGVEELAVGSHVVVRSMSPRWPFSKHRAWRSARLCFRRENA